MEFKLKKIYVSHYKNLVDCHLDINDFAVIVGANNSGKSNFFELFEILDNIFFGGDKGRKNAAKIVLESKKPTTIIIEYTVYKNREKINAQYEIRFIVKKIENKLNLFILYESLKFKSPKSTGSAKRLFLRKNGELKLRGEKGSFNKRLINNDITVYDVLRVLYTEVKDLPDDYYFFIPLLFIFDPSIITTHKMSENYNEEIEELGERLFIFQEQKNEKYEIFKKHFLDILDLEDLTFHELTFLNDEKEKPIYVCAIIEEKRNKPTPINYMSDGTKILFLMLYNIFFNDSEFICIEEPEVGLHPKALSKLLQLFFNKDVPCQAIITTHSPYLLTLVNPENVFLLEGKEEGMYTFKNVSTIQNLKQRLKSKYVNFGDLFVDNFETQIDTTLD